MKRRFEIEFTGTAIIEIDSTIIDAAMEEEWQNMFYDFIDSHDVAEHLAYNYIINDATIKQLDGFADQDIDSVKIIERPDWELSTREIKGAPDDKR